MWTQVIIALVVVSLAGMSIPILEIMRSKPKNPEYEKRIRDLEKRLEALEGENASKSLDIEELRKELSFTTKLLDK